MLSVAYYSPQSGVNVVMQPQVTFPRKDYLICSLINLIFCGCVLGIPAVICSCLAREKYDKGDFNGGNSNGNSAKILNIIAFVLGAIGYIIVIILFATGIALVASVASVIG